MPHVADIFLQAIANGAPYLIEQRIRRFDGAYRLTRGLNSQERTLKTTAYQQYCTDMDRTHERNRLGLKQFGEALLRITRGGLVMRTGKAGAHWWSMVRADASEFSDHSGLVVPFPEDDLGAEGLGTEGLGTEGLE